MVLISNSPGRRRTHDKRQPRHASSVLRVIFGLVVVSFVLIAAQHAFLKPQIAERFAVRKRAIAMLAENPALDAKPPQPDLISAGRKSPAGEDVTAASTLPPAKEVGLPNGEDEIAATVQRATVRVINRSQQTAGSGVVIGHSGPAVYILSARHVVENADKISLQFFTAVQRSEPIENYDNVELVAKSPTADLALLRMTGMVSEEAELHICPTELMPKDFPLAAFAAGWSETRQPVVESIQILGKKLIRKSKSDSESLVFEVNGESIRGRSGGPLVDRLGRVLGIASGTSESKGYFSHAEEIYRFLKQNGLQWIVQGPSNIE